MPDKKGRGISNVPIKIPDVVDTPTIGTATEGIESATVAFTPNVKGGLASSFIAVSTPDSITGTGSSSPITVTGLTGETAYTFKVYGVNSSGTWSNNISSSSNSVTPLINASFESIATATPSSGATTVTFSSIPSTYKSLQLRISGIQKTYNVAFYLYVNGDNTSGNYTMHELSGDGSNTASSGGTTADGFYLSYNNGTNASTSPVGSIVEIIDYASTSKNKTIRGITGQDRNGSGVIALGSSLWKSTSAINSITIIGTLYDSGTTIALYGIK